MEALEDRRLLAGVVVGNNLDVVNGDTTTIANLIANAGGDGISLREAMLAANATAGADVITFAAALSGQTITLLGGLELVARRGADDRRPAAGRERDDQRQSAFADLQHHGVVGRLHLGRADAHRREHDRPRREWPGRRGPLASVRQSDDRPEHHQRKSAPGNFGHGGGIFAQGAVTLTQSTVSGNSIAGNFGGGGGGVFSNGGVTLIESIVAGNIAPDRGGGIHSSGAVMLTHSTVSGNSGQGGGGSMPQAILRSATAR